MTLKNKIIQHLERKGSYDQDVDLFVIEELIDNIALSKLSMDILKAEGPIINQVGTNGQIIVKQNPAMNTYQMTCRNVQQLASRLGINRADRLRLKLIEQKEVDPFEQDMK